VGWFKPRDESRCTDTKLVRAGETENDFWAWESWFIDGIAKDAPGRQQGESRSVTALLEAVNLV
jgi:hypothetical protein